MSKKAAKKSAPKKAAAKAEKKTPGVIDRIVEVLQNGGGTIDAIAAKVSKHFPDRQLTAITATTRSQVTRLARTPEQGGRGVKVRRGRDR